MNTKQAVPSQATPIVLANGTASPSFWQLVLMLFNRTGGPAGVDAAALQASSGPAFAQGIGVFGHAPPATQPGTPATLAEVAAVLRAYGFSA